MFACVVADAPIEPLLAVGRAFSPRVEVQGGAVLLDVSGLGRIVGDPPAVGRELAREARDRGIAARVAVAATRTAALLLAQACEGVTIAAPGDERAAVADVPLGVLSELTSAFDLEPSPLSEHLLTLRRWGLRTLGDLAALAPAALFERMGNAGLALHRVACGRDDRPLVTRVDPERFEASVDLEWPIESLEPLSFVLARLLEPLSQALERAGRGASAIELRLTLVTRQLETRRLDLPAPMRDARTLRTLLLLHLEAHPVTAGIDRVAVVIEPALARVVQFSLLQRARPSPEALSTLVARLEAVMGAGRAGAPALVDSHAPDAFELTPFRTEARGQGPEARRQPTGTEQLASGPRPLASDLQPLASVLRRFRLPVPARVDVGHGRPVRVTTMRRGIAGGRVEQCAGPWRSSGGWWQAAGVGPRGPWNKDELDVVTPDGLYRIYRQRDDGRWFIEGILD